MEKYQEIERSIIKRYRKDIWHNFVKAVADYKLINENDHIMVCISGGKDSFLLAKCIQELIRHGKVKFTARYVVMNPGYNEVNLNLIKENAKLLNVPIEIFESDIFNIVSNIDKSPCYLCARMRRGCLYNKAQELGCNKIALGHHFDDVIETTMLNLLCAGNFKTMLPKLKSSNYEKMQIIRPLYYIREESIIRFIQNSGIMPLNCACMVAAKKTGNKRYEIKELIKNLGEEYQEVEKSIFKAANNVYLDSVLGWEQDGVRHSFLEKFED